MTFSNLLCNPVQPSHFECYMSLCLSRGGDGGRIFIANFAAAATRSLNRLDHFHRLLVGHLAEDDMLPIEPTCDNSGDEELRSIAKSYVSFRATSTLGWDGHTYSGQHWPLIGDRGACASLRSSHPQTSPHKLTSHLCPVEVSVDVMMYTDLADTNVAASEVTALKHEVRDHTVELRVGVTKSFLTGAESTEVLGGLGDYIVIQEEVDAA